MMAFIKKTWKDRPDTSTPLDANGLNDLEGRIGNDIDNITTQLAEKVGQGKKAELEDLSPTVLSAIEGGDGTSFNLLSIPQDFSVTPQKMASFAGLNMYPFHKKAVIHANGEIAKEVGEAIKDIKLYGADDTTQYRIGTIVRKRYSESVDEYSWNVSIFNSFDLEVCRFFKINTYEEPNGLTKLTLGERNSSGITGVVLMDWAKLTEGRQVHGLGYEETGVDKSTYSGDIYNLSMTLTEENQIWEVE